jgi:regulator of replication initiation timing
MCDRCKLYEIQVKNLEKKLAEMTRRWKVEEGRTTHYMEERDNTQNRYIKILYDNGYHLAAKLIGDDDDSQGTR